MDPQLSLDLSEALSGCDPLEFLLVQEPDLVAVAEEVLREDKCVDDIVESTPEETSASASPSPSSSSSDGSGGGSKRKRRSSAPCVVCAHLTKGHVYFGAVVCHSCRAFFTRAIKDEAYKDFVCENAFEGDGLCQLDTKSWGSCAKCRFKRCRRGGMRFPGESLKVKPDAQVTLLLSREGNCDLTMDLATRLRALLAPSTALTLEEKLDVEAMAWRHQRVDAHNMVRLFRGNLDLLRLSLEVFYTGRSIPLKEYKMLEDYMTYGAMQDYACGDAWNTNDRLTPRDRGRLVAANFPLMTELSEVARLCFVSNKDIDLFLQSLTQDLDRDERKLIEDVFSEVTDGGRTALSPPSYDDFFDADELSSAVSPSELARYRSCTSRLSRMLRGWGDPVVFMLAACVVLYTPDFVDLDDAAEAQRMQTAFACLLHRYLRSKNHPRSDLLFGEAMMVTSYVRDMSEFKEKAFRRLKM